jgi:hypothetical protein
MAKLIIDTHFTDGKTWVHFDGTNVPKAEWRKRTEHLKAAGFKFNGRERAWFRKGDCSEQIKLELDHLDAIKAAEDSHKAPEKQPEKAPEKTTITIEQALTDPALMEKLATFCMPKMTKECAQVLLGIVFDSVAQGRYIGGRLNENVA